MWLNFTNVLGIIFVSGTRFLPPKEIGIDIRSIFLAVVFSGKQIASTLVYLGTEKLCILFGRIVHGTFLDSSWIS